MDVYDLHQMKKQSGAKDLGHGPFLASHVGLPECKRNESWKLGE